MVYNMRASEANGRAMRGINQTDARHQPKHARLMRNMQARHLWKN